MTDQEIIERIASDFMGWQNLPITARRKPRGITVWFWRLDGTMCVKGIRALSTFDPLHDPVSCMLVLDEIERRGWYWEWNRDWGSNQFVIFKRPGEDGKLVKQIAIAIDDNRYRAVCLVVLEAIGK